MTNPEDREFTDRWRSRILAAQTDLIDAFGGPKRVIEKYEKDHRASKSEVYRWHGGSARDYMPMPLVMQIEGKLDRSIVSAVMIEFLDRELAAREASGAELACLSTHTAELVEVSGRMMVETVRAKADGIVTPNEAKHLRALSRKVERIRSDIDDELARAEAREPRGEK